jgi:hypothetical protein
MNVRRLASTFAVVALLALAPASHASVVRPQTLENLVDRASLVVVATPAERTSVWEGGRIVTYTRVDVRETVAGPASASLWVRTLGGEVGDLGQRVDGEATLEIGKPTLLFLEATETGSYVVAARAQGQFMVDERPAGPVLRPHPSMGAFMTKGPRDVVLPAADRLKARALAEAARTIRARWGQSHAQR